MGCCSQTTAQPWWASVEVDDSKRLSQRKALGIEEDDQASWQWYLYSGLKHGASQHPVNGHAYYAGRLGSNRFVKIKMDHVATFEGLYGSSFALLGASNDVTISSLLTPAHNYAHILPAGITERTLRQYDIAKAGDIVGSNPAMLSQELKMNQSSLQSWILSMRKEVGFGNMVSIVSAQIPASMQSAHNGQLSNGRESGKVEMFDFAAIAGVTPAMENLLLQQGVLSSRNFIDASNEDLSNLLNLPATTVVSIKDDIRHHVADKGQSTKLRRSL